MEEIAFSFIIEGEESESAANEIRDIVKEEFDYDYPVKKDIKLRWMFQKHLEL